MNCWEFMKCGREPGGCNTYNSGICPAAADSALDGKNSGKNGGRYCWKVAGTLGNGIIQGTFGSKIINCIECDFFKKVQSEEGENFLFTM